MMLHSDSVEVYVLKSSGEMKNSLNDSRSSKWTIENNRTENKSKGNGFGFEIAELD